MATNDNARTIHTNLYSDKAEIILSAFCRILGDFGVERECAARLQPFSLIVGLMPKLCSYTIVLAIRPPCGTSTRRMLNPATGLLG